MRHVVIAFNTTGPTPKNGHRFSELVAVEQLDGELTGRKLHLLFDVHPEASTEKTFAGQFDRLDELIGNAPVVVHRAGVWAKFMRAELRNVKKRGARRLPKQAIDVCDWAQQRVYGRRKDIWAIANRFDIQCSPDLQGLDRDVEQLRLIALLAAALVLR